MEAIQKHKLSLTLGAIGAAFLLVGLLVPDLNECAKGFVGNLIAEGFGVFAGSAITIAVIDELLARRERRSKVHKALKQAEGLLLDVAARALWGSKNYVPGALTARSSNQSDLEPWQAIINLLADTNKWDSVRLGANEPAPEELSRLSPRIWDVIAVPPEVPPNLNVARKASVVAGCADDLERIATEFIPELIDDLLDARASSAVITHWVSVFRHTHLTAVGNDGLDHFFSHVAGAIWEVLILLDESFDAIPHPLRPSGKESSSDREPS